MQLTVTLDVPVDDDYAEGTVSVVKDGIVVEKIGASFNKMDFSEYFDIVMETIRDSIAEADAEGLIDLGIPRTDEQITENKPTD